MPTQKEKIKFRQSRRWQLFKQEMQKQHGNRCVLCERKLGKGWNLHHRDMNPDMYEVLEPSRFAPLCKSCHKCVHAMHEVKSVAPAMVAIKGVIAFLFTPAVSR